MFAFQEVYTLQAIITVSQPNLNLSPLPKPLRSFIMEEEVVVL